MSNDCCEPLTSQHPCCDNAGNMIPRDYYVPPNCVIQTKLGYDADQMPMALRPKCPCCGCRQNPLDEIKISEVKRDGCAFDPCSPCHNKTYERYYDSFLVCPPNPCCPSQPCCPPQPMPCPAPCPQACCPQPCCPPPCQPTYQACDAWRGTWYC